MTMETQAGESGQAAAWSEETKNAPKPYFMPFEWVNADGVNPCLYSTRQVVQFASITRDIASGARTIFEMLERDECVRVNGDDDVLMSPLHAGHLQRMAITALDLLSDEAERIHERIYEAIRSERAPHEP
jgi:hypothetical protein